jgi:hypothetical protein
MPGASRDKDGVLAAGLFAECAAYLRSERKQTMSDYLLDIYKTYVSCLLILLTTIIYRYGYHLICSSYFINKDPTLTKRFFDKIRYGNEYPPNDAPLNVRLTVYISLLFTFIVFAVSNRNCWYES